MQLLRGPRETFLVYAGLSSLPTSLRRSRLVRYFQKDHRERQRLAGRAQKWADIYKPGSMSRGTGSGDLLHDRIANRLTRVYPFEVFDKIGRNEFSIKSFPPEQFGDWRSRHLRLLLVHPQQSEGFGSSHAIPSGEVR